MDHCTSALCGVVVTPCEDHALMPAKAESCARMTQVSGYSRPARLRRFGKHVQNLQNCTPAPGLWKLHVRVAVSSASPRSAVGPFIGPVRQSMSSHHKDNSGIPAVFRANLPHAVALMDSPAAPEELGRAKTSESNSSCLEEPARIWLILFGRSDRLAEQSGMWKSAPGTRGTSPGFRRGSLPTQ